MSDKIATVQQPELNEAFQNLKKAIVKAANSMTMHGSSGELLFNINLVTLQIVENLIHDTLDMQVQVVSGGKLTKDQLMQQARKAEEDMK